MFSVIRIPTKFSKTIRRLTDKEKVQLFSLLMDIGDDKKVDPPESIVGDILTLIYGEWMNMESNRSEYNPNWKGGITKENQKIRNSKEYKKWRNSIFTRDCFTCCICGSVGGILNAHHIEKFSENKKKRLDIGNGITLCKKCHILIHKKNK